MILITFVLKLSAPKLKSWCACYITLFRFCSSACVRCYLVLMRLFSSTPHQSLTITFVAFWSPSSYVFCWRHRGFNNPSVHPYLPDKVYVNSFGQCCLYRSYRGAILTALRMPRAFLTISHVTFVDSAALFLSLFNSASGILPLRAVLGRARLEALVHVRVEIGVTLSLYQE